MSHTASAATTIARAGPWAWRRMVEPLALSPWRDATGYGRLYALAVIAVAVLGVRFLEERSLTRLAALAIGCWGLRRAARASARRRWRPRTHPSPPGYAPDRGASPSCPPALTAPWAGGTATAARTAAKAAPRREHGLAWTVGYDEAISELQALEDEEVRVYMGQDQGGTHLDFCGRLEGPGPDREHAVFLIGDEGHVAVSRANFEAAAHDQGGLWIRTHSDWLMHVASADPLYVGRRRPRGGGGVIDRLRGWWNRPIPEARRGLAYTLAATVITIAGVAAIVSSVRRDDPPQASRPAPAAPPPTPTTGRPVADPAAIAVPDEGVRAPEGAVASPEQIAAAKKASQRFLDGYLPWTYGRGDAMALETATVALRRRLDAQPPRVPPAQRERTARVELMQVQGAASRRMGMVAIVNDGRARYSVSLQLARYPEGWKVTDVGL